MQALGIPKYITIHCAATPEGRDVKAATISQWDIARFNQVSYHYVIELDGTIVPTLDTKYLGAHVGGHNSNNIGVCYVGGMDSDNAQPKDTRTDAQKQAMLSLVNKLKAKFHTVTKVLGHRDWPGVKKACPSFDVKGWLASA